MNETLSFCLIKVDFFEISSQTSQHFEFILVQLLTSLQKNPMEKTNF